MQIVNTTSLPFEEVKKRVAQIVEVAQIAEVAGDAPAPPFDDQVYGLDKGVFLYPKGMVMGLKEGKILWCLLNVPQKEEGVTKGFRSIFFKVGLSGGLDIESRLHEILPPSEEMYCQVLSNLEVGDNIFSLEFEEQGSKLAELFHFIGCVACRSETLTKIDVSKLEEGSVGRLSFFVLGSLCDKLNEETMECPSGLGAIVPFSSIFAVWVRIVSVKEGGLSFKESFGKCFECFKRSYDELVENKCTLSEYQFTFPEELSEILKG